MNPAERPSLADLDMADHLGLPPKPPTEEPMRSPTPIAPTRTMRDQRDLALRAIIDARTHLLYAHTGKEIGNLEQAWLAVRAAYDALQFALDETPAEVLDWLDP